MAITPADPIRTVGDLRAAIHGLADDLPVQVHVGVDVSISEWDADESGGLVLFPDDESGTSWVSTDWLYKEHPELRMA